VVHVPRGFATGYLVLEPDTEVLYFSDRAYKSELEAGIRWNDPVLTSIQWKISRPILSEKDGQWLDFK
jgi:dTDP-4-dehydrorhamnose 3,5-epimerase